MVAIFAASALLLATIGIYGLLSYSVAQRTYEIGIRATLGASRKNLLRLVLGQGLILTSIGLVLGMAGALGLTRFLESLLYGVEARDAVTMVAVGVILAVVAVGACWVPARRASTIDPMVALRSPQAQ